MTRITALFALAAVTAGMPCPGIAGDTVVIELRGRIKPECTVSGTSAAEILGDITTAGIIHIPLHVYCNAPFLYKISSRHGALRHRHAHSSPRDFKILVPYTVQIRLPTDSGDIIDICSSVDLRRPVQCRFTDSANAISSDRIGVLTVSWTANPHALAGTFSDVLTFTIGPRF